MARKLVFIGCLLIITGYISVSIVPNVFAPKISDTERVKNMQIIAHRGGSGLGPENSLSCIEKGITSGADTIEIDVHMTKDGYLLVCHDQTVNRTTNGRGEIRAMRLSEIRELRLLDADGNITDEYMPTLGEVLELVNGRAGLLIEIKQPRRKYPDIEQKLMDEIEKYQAFSWVTVQSFDDSILENIHAIDPQQRLEKLLFCKLPGLPLIFDECFSIFNYSKYSYISSFNIYYKAATPGFINDIHDHGKEVKIWTLTSPQKTPDLPVDGVITNRPDLWKNTL